MSSFRACTMAVPAVWWAALCGVLTAPFAFAADPAYEVYVESGVEYDSNVFRVDSNANVPTIGGKQVRGDVTYSNSLGAKGTYEYALQSFRADGVVRRFDYVDLPRLSHFEYTLGAGYDYRILDRVGGTLDYQESRRQSRFEDRNNGTVATRLNFDRDRSGGISTKYLVLEDWTIDGSYRLHSLSTPVLGAPSLKLDESTATGGFSYVGVSHLSAGLSGSYQDGRYTGIPVSTRFKAYSGNAVVNYKTTEDSTLALTGGYTRRNDEGLSSTGGFTGDLAYTYAFTEKTLTTFRLFRHISSYAAGDNTVLETGVSNESRWRVTPKVELEATYDYLHVKFRNNGLVGNQDLAGRTDIFRTSGFRAIYTALDWLELSTTASYAVRRSSLQSNNFNAATLAFSVKATYK